MYRIGAATYDKERAALLAVKADESEVRCPDEEATERMKAEIDAARYARDALGGEFVVVAEGCPPGLGSYVDWRDKLDAKLAHAVAAAMKPISTIAKALRTVDLATYEPSRAFRERADTSAVPAAAVIAEAMVAVVLAEAFSDKFGADNITDIRASYDSYHTRLQNAARNAARGQEARP